MSNHFLNIKQMYDHQLTWVGVESSGNTRHDTVPGFSSENSNWWYLDMPRTFRRSFWNELQSYVGTLTFPEIHGQFKFITLI